MSELSEDKLEKTLAAQIETGLSTPPELGKKLALFARITETTPYLLCLAVIFVLARDASIAFPKDFPYLGEWIGGRQLNSQVIARWFPFILAGIVLWVHARARKRGLEWAHTRDYAIALVRQHRWRRDRFLSLFVAAMEKKSLGWVVKLSEMAAKWNPDSLGQILRDWESGLPAGAESADAKSAFRETLSHLLEDDFEARFHGLVNVESHPRFKPWNMAIDPVVMLLAHGRADGRASALVKSGVEGVFLEDLDSLPGGTETRLHRRLVPWFTLWPLLTFGGALLGCFIIADAGWWFRAFTVAVGIGSVTSVALWNYRLIVERRGLPAGFTLRELQGDSRMVRGL